jgi:hypothetical protein
MPSHAERLLAIADRAAVAVRPLEALGLRHESVGRLIIELRSGSAHEPRMLEDHALDRRGAIDREDFRE